MTAPPRDIPPVDQLTYAQRSGWSCVWCGTPITTGGYSAGTARGRIGAHILDTEVYAGPCCPPGARHP